MKRIILSFIVMLALPMTMKAMECETSETAQDTCATFQSMQIDLINQLLPLLISMQGDDAMTVLKEGQKKIKEATGVEASPELYIVLVSLLTAQQNYDAAIATCQVCLDTYKDDLSVSNKANVYFLCAKAYYDKEDFARAIDVFKVAADLFGQYSMANVGDVYAFMANSYYILGEPEQYYEYSQKSMDILMPYFRTTREALLKADYADEEAKDSYLYFAFGRHLFEMSLIEHELGNQQAADDYLKMARHCGVEEDSSNENTLRQSRHA